MISSATTPQPSGRICGRADLRYPASAFPTITGTRISPGEPVVLVDMSNSGISVECDRNFTPGRSVAVIFEGSFSPRQVRARVVRCHVSRIVEGTLRFISGLMFENPLDLSKTAALEPQPAASATTLSQNLW